MGELSFRKRVALVTGSSRGIGSVIARAFSEMGAHVVITYRKEGGSSEARGKKLCEEINEMGGRAVLINCDISQKKSVRKAINDTQAHFGRLDFLILNAARAPFKPIEKLFERELKDLVNTNYLGQIFCIQESIPMLEKTQGKIVFISSLGSHFYNPSYPLGSMKAAMESVVRDCAESLRERGISVNGVCGGIVRTDSFKTLRMYWDGIDRLPEWLFVTPKELADVAIFLCGHESRGITGQTLVVDKGLSNSLLRCIGP
jgi:NAD(P)-dependent dehydrogenase (short-subunit alcohol dehydrogenase family)